LGIDKQVSIIILTKFSQDIFWSSRRWRRWASWATWS